MPFYGPLLFPKPPDPEQANETGAEKPDGCGNRNGSTESIIMTGRGSHVEPGYDVSVTVQQLQAYNLRTVINIDGVSRSSISREFEYHIKWSAIREFYGKSKGPCAAPAIAIQV